jgi:hypothetical protein
MWPVNRLTKRAYNSMILLAVVLGRDIEPNENLPVAEHLVSSVLLLSLLSGNETDVYGRSSSELTL